MPIPFPMEMRLTPIGIPWAPASEAELEAFLEAGRLATLGELVGGCAHEINNPLFATLALVSLALDEVEPGTKQHERLSLIQGSAGDIKAVVQRMHDFSRRRSSPPAVVSLTAVAHAAVDLVSNVSMQRDVEIVERYADASLPVHGDAGQLQLLLVNLILNAFQALPGGGTVEVEVARDGNEIVVVVSDDGPGFPADGTADGFELFRSTRRGTGLGLALCRTIAERHGGSLAAETAASGARLVLRLPESA